MGNEQQGGHNVLIGTSRPEQIVENAACIEKLDFSDEEIAEIEKILGE